MIKHSQLEELGEQKKKNHYRSQERGCVRKRTWENESLILFFLIEYFFLFTTFLNVMSDIS